MEVEHTDENGKGHFKAMENGVHAGILTYKWSGPDTFVIEHTVGNPEFKGIGMVLLNEAVAFAREKNVKIVPQCPFAKKMFDRKPELHDVLAN